MKALSGDEKPAKGLRQSASLPGEQTDGAGRYLSLTEDPISYCC